MKSKLKKILLGFAFAKALLFATTVSAQGMPVYDNTNFVSLVKQLVESAKQTSELVKSVKFLKEAKERIEQVSGVIRQLKAVEEIGSNNQRLIQMMQNDLQDILNSPYIKPEEVQRVTESFEAIVDHSIDTMDFIDEILSSNHLNMSDAERTEVLKQKEMESKEMVSNIKIRTKRYEDIISFRKMQDKINNRETSF